MRKTNEDTKCMVTSVAIVSMPFLLIFVYSFVNHYYSGALATFLCWMIIGGLISCGVILIGIVLLSILTIVMGIFSDL